MYIHFVAIGGAIMHQLALALYRKGNRITGSDDEINDPAKTNLHNAGLLPEKQGWFPEKITTDIDAIVLGMHAKGNNPELLRAQQLGIPIYSFPQYVYEVSKEKQRVVVAGSHGKTTITSMIMHILKTAGMEFDYLVGAKVDGFGQSVQLTDAPLIVLEGDEYPASVIEKKPKIFFYQPHISVLSGIAWDHINVFPTYENYCSQFEQYLAGMTQGATVFYNAEDNEVVRIIHKSASHLHAIPYHFPAFHYDNGQAIVLTEEGPVTLSIFGRHNLLNMEAAIAVCEVLGLERNKCYQAISNFTGAAKRLEKLGETEKLVAYRDFAHAPSKLKATLDAVREAYPTHRLIACFELHTYSSLSEAFLSEYKGSMAAADDAIVYFSHHALSLKGLPELQMDTVKDYFGQENLMVLAEKELLEEKIRELLSGTDQKICLLLMSSGTFDGIEWSPTLHGEKSR
ncbi:MAG TPA: Mur ligase family protein [Flavipsychrobacter sp.]|nr:Mur ligase family protein [Flavipsychrobacter sp.]